MGHVAFTATAIAVPYASRSGLRAVRHALFGSASVVLALLVWQVAALAKDIGPQRPACDGLAKESAAWTVCATASATSDDELFYAGYWLAKTGSYRAALGMLERVAVPSARVHTYIGFAHRKLGEMDAALASYGKALAANPDFTVARAYLGEAYLTLGQEARAVGELDEIRRRCGEACAEFADLAGHIAKWRLDNSSDNPRKG